MSLSRLQADFFTKNLHYATTYWVEHSHNFCQVITHLMTDDTLQRVANSAASLTLTFNHKTEWIPQEYNMEVIHGAYANFMEELKTDKLFLCKFTEAYFNVFVKQIQYFDPTITALPRNKQDPKNSQELVNIKRVFTNPAFDNTELAPIAETLLGKGYDVEKCFNYFYPQLILFLLRFLDIYDQSMQGLTVKEYSEKDFNLNNKKPSDEREKLIKNIGKQVLQSFGTMEFWKARYSKVTSSTPLYDWYIAWDQLKPLLMTHVIPLQKFVANKSAGKQSASPSVLHLGCGNSSLSEDIHDSGIVQVAGIDFCPEVIEVMLSRKERLNKPELIYEHMDARGLRFDNERFDVVIDKGCIDCMVCVPEGPDSSREFMNCCLREVARVLKRGGFYILVSCGINEDSFKSFKIENFNWKIVYVDRIQGKEGLNFDLNVLIVQRQ